MSTILKTYTDQLNRTIAVNFPPQKIVSLVPSQTELLFDLGLDEEIVGITKFCIHPKHHFRRKTKVGGTKDFSIERIHALQPDLIIANKEENERTKIEQLCQQYPVWISDVVDLTSAYAMILGIGQVVGRVEKAEEMVKNMQQAFLKLPPLPAKPLTVAYLIWKNPYMAVGQQTFIHHLLTIGGFKNVFEQLSRYPAITTKQLSQASPDVLFLASEPYPFKQKHIHEIQPLLPHTNIQLIDGELFSWYGSRLLQSADYLYELRKQLST